VTTWDQFVPPFARAVETYFREQGTDPASPAAQSTVTTNTEVVPVRTEILLRTMRSHTPVRSVEGLTVLDAGCGFGACSVYVATHEGAAHVTGADLSDVFLDVGRAVLRECPVGNVEFVQANMTALPLADSAYDVVLVNNSFIYFDDKADVDRALAELHRVAKGGAAIVFYQPNRWTYREAFTRMPLVHLLPRKLGDRVVARSGKRSGLLDVRYLSPPDHMRRLRKVGFRKVRLVSPRNLDAARGIRRYFAPYYAISGVKP
jgi:ubiquinone/menaquinone biosynthesis C-methylase UbiE